MIKHHTTRPLISRQIQYLFKPIPESSNKTKKSNTKRVQNENRKMPIWIQNNLLKKMLTIMKVINRLTALKSIQKAKNS